MARTRQQRAARHAAGAVLIAALLSVAGCATPPQTVALHNARNHSAPVELTSVPFFPQQAYQCGPAALATVLNWSGLNLAPEALAPQVYLPARQGSLQVELIAAARRHGRIPYVLRPDLTDLFAEVSAQHPVLVLLNLGLSWYPVWHYAVVVGFDIDRDEVILRSGRLRRDVVRLAVFERIWSRSGYWALLVLPPRELPATAQETPYLQAVAELERLQQWHPAAQAYQQAMMRWPGSLGAAMGLGNSRYALDDLPGAEQAFRDAIARHPDAAPAFNNLAQVLAEQGRIRDAEQAARQAIKLGGPLSETYRETLRQILDQQRGMKR